MIFLQFWLIFYVLPGSVSWFHAVDPDPQHCFFFLEINSIIDLIYFTEGEEASISHRLRVTSQLFDMLSDNSQVRLMKYYQN